MSGERKMKERKKNVKTLKDVEQFLQVFNVNKDVVATTNVYDWDAVLAKIKEFNLQKRQPVTVGMVHQLFAKDVKYRNEVRQWMERCVDRGLLIRYPPRTPGAPAPKRVLYVHIDAYNELVKNK